MTQVVYIHGLGQTHRSFNYLLTLLPDHDHKMIDYDSQQPLADSIEQVRNRLPRGDLILVGHSLGGVISAIIAGEDDRIKRLVTISSPVSGSKMASTLRWLPGSLPIMSDIVPKGKYIVLAGNLMLTIPTLSLISTGGHLPTSPEPNDGVVAIESQKGLQFGKKIEVNTNHFEILQHEKTAKHISDFIFAEEGLSHEDHLKTGT